MAKKVSENPPHEVVLDILNYDPGTGVFTWKTRPRCLFKSNRAYNAFNANFAGRVAGHTCDKGYIRVDIGGRSIRAHRLAWFYVHGTWPKEIDHIDGIRTNNSICNLREVNRRENSRNRCIRSDSSTGHNGVYVKPSPAGDRWIALISAPSGKRIVLGHFTEKQDAIFARKIAEKCFAYHKNHGRPSRG